MLDVQISMGCTLNFFFFSFLVIIVGTSGGMIEVPVD